MRHHAAQFKVFKTMRFDKTDTTKLLIHGSVDRGVLDYTQSAAGEIRDHVFAYIGGTIMVELTYYVGMRGTYRDPRYVLTVWECDQNDYQHPHDHGASDEIIKVEKLTVVYNDHAEAFAAWGGYIADNTYRD